MKRTIPYGYEFRDGYIGVEKNASSVVRGIYIEYLNGKSFATIAKELTAKGIDYYQGKTEWNKQMVKRVLECPMYCGTEKYPQIIEEAQFKAVAKLIATKYGGYNNDARATVLRKRTFCQECGERIWHDMQHPKYRRWVCKKCNEHPIKDDDFYKKVTEILNAVIDHPELLDEVEPKDTYESEYGVTSKANQVTHMLTSPGVNFESAFEDILNLASLKYDNCEYDITEELTETIKQDYIGRQRLDDVDTELIERTVSHLTVNNQGKIAIHFINGATVKTEGET